MTAINECYHTVTNDFVLFWGGPFSQWAMSDFEIDDVKYNCTEQYMMAAKAMFFNDTEAHKKIMESNNPSDQKQIGREIKGFDTLQWRGICFDIVVRANVAKFTQNEELKQILIESGNKIIVEASPYDKIWGVGLQESDPRCENPALWQGENLLGLALMVARNKIK